MHQHLWRGTTWHWQYNKALCWCFEEKNTALISSFLFYTSERLRSPVITSTVQARFVEYRHIWPEIWHLLNHLLGLNITQFRLVCMLEARNKVKLPCGCVNAPCQVHHRSPLDIIHIETLLAKHLREAAITSRMSEQGTENHESFRVSVKKKWNYISVRQRERERQGEKEFEQSWNHPVRKRGASKILVSSDYFWMTTLLSGSVCVQYFSTLLTELAIPDRLQLPNLPPPHSSLLCFPSLLRCWDAMLCRWLITRVALGGDEGRSQSGSDSCLCHSADCRRALPSECDKCRCSCQKWCHSLHLNYSKSGKDETETALLLLFFYYCCSASTWICLLLFSSRLKFLTTGFMSSIQISVSALPPSLIFTQ